MRGRAFLCGVALLLTIVSSAAAQNYRFEVPRMDVVVEVQPDASVEILYRIEFRNHGDPIDVVDIGLPHEGYSISSMKARIGDVPCPKIAPSTYIPIGVEVHLARPIPTGTSGEFFFRCIQPEMVYKDTTDSSRASLQFKPTWFDSSVCFGQTHLSISIVLPPGVAREEVEWHSDDRRYQALDPVKSGEVVRIRALWDYPGHRLGASNPKVGLSFPRQVMERVVEISAFELLLRWFEGHPDVQGWSGFLLGLLLTFVYFRFSGATGGCLYVFGIGAYIVAVLASPAIHLLLWPVGVVLLVLNERTLSVRRASYLPAMATVEGGGIKRGLTAPEAALLLEIPLSRVLALVLYGLLKKGILRQVADDPLTVEVDEPFRVSSHKKRRRIAADRGIVLRSYEQKFIHKLRGKPKEVVGIDFSRSIGDMIKSVVDKMKGFDLDSSCEYYRRIVERAWIEAESIGEIEKRTEAVDQNFEWMLIEDDYPDRFDTWAHRGTPYRPLWIRNLPLGSAPAASAPAVGERTTFGEVAASFTGWMEKSAGRVVGSIEPTRMGIKIDPSAGVVDLSGIDKMTGEFFEAVASSSGSGGGGGGGFSGGGGGCACACAGCACACACAGGGR